MNRDSVITLATYFRDKIGKYFDKLSILRTQIPEDMRLLLLPRYMTWTNFQSDIRIDPYHNFGFEIYRRSETAIPITFTEINEHVEKEIFGFYSQTNNCLIHSSFTLNLKFKDIQFDVNENMGVISLSFSDCRFTDCNIIGTRKGKKPFVKQLNFAWIIERSVVRLNDIVDPLLYAEEDFFSALFDKVKKLLSIDYQFGNKATQRKVIEYFIKLVERVEKEIRDTITITEADEHVFQQLLNTYKFFLYPSAESITSQYRIGEGMQRISDFRVRVNEKLEIHVEIEPPFYQVFNENSIPSSRLQTALNQISEWRQIFQKDGNDVRYIIIIGLNLRMTISEQSVLREFNKAQSDLTVVTWDWVVQNIENVRTKLKDKFFQI